MLILNMCVLGVYKFSSTSVCYMLAFVNVKELSPELFISYVLCQYSTICKENKLKSCCFSISHRNGSGILLSLSLFTIVKDLLSHS